MGGGLGGRGGVRGSIKSRTPAPKHLGLDLTSELAGHAQPEPKRAIHPLHGEGVVLLCSADLSKACFASRMRESLFCNKKTIFKGPAPLSY